MTYHRVFNKGTTSGAEAVCIKKEKPQKFELELSNNE
jgi:hypothetical protein